MKAPSTSRRRRRLIPWAVGAALAVAASAGIAAPANAAVSDCPSGYTCIWRDSTYVTNGSGTALVKFQYYIPDYSTWSYAGTSINAGGNAISVYNNGNTDATRLYSSINKGGYYFQLAIKTGDGNISNSSGYIQGVSWRPWSGYFQLYW
jgi:hypothetical protein